MDRKQLGMLQIADKRDIFSRILNRKVTCPSCTLLQFKQLAKTAVGINILHIFAVCHIQLFCRDLRSVRIGNNDVVIVHLLQNFAVLD
ncbi:hypothetical protein D3C73_985390 [compost metagenome]